VGALRPQEPTGEGDDTMRLSCKVFTQANDGALDDMDTLDQMRLEQSPVICVRGDGYNFGWRIITLLEETGRKLDLSGVAKVIEFEITLKKVPRPSNASMLSLFSSLLG
jgi:phage protein U